MNTQEDRINRLNQKLKKIDVVDRGGRLGKLAGIENRVVALEAKFEQWKGQHEGDTKQLKQQFSKLAAEVDEHNANWLSNLNIEKLIDAVSLMAQKVELISDGHRQNDQRILRVIEERSRGIKNEIAKERKSRAEAVEDLCIIIKESFPKLEEQIAEEALRRTEADELIHKKLSQEVSEMELELSKEKATKEENEKAIFDVIKDTVEKVKRELETEKRDRENSEQSLMRLLEDSMGKLNSIVHS
jgi:hypothetical protein